MPTVTQFNERLAKEELKKCPKIVQDYVKLLNEHLDRQKELTNKAISKLRELANDTKKLKEMTEDSQKLLNELKG